MQQITVYLMSPVSLTFVAFIVVYYRTFGIHTEKVEVVINTKVCFLEAYPWIEVQSWVLLESSACSEFNNMVRKPLFTDGVSSLDTCCVSVMLKYFGFGVLGK